MNTAMGMWRTSRIAAKVAWKMVGSATVRVPARPCTTWRLSRWRTISWPVGCFNTRRDGEGMATSAARTRRSTRLQRRQAMRRTYPKASTRSGFLT